MEQPTEAQVKENGGIYGISRKLWVALANDQLKRRKRYMGSSFAKPCSTCIEILMCDGPVGLHICRTIEQMQKDGLVEGPKKIPFEKLRRKLLPVSKDCLIAYGIIKGRADKKTQGEINACLKQTKEEVIEKAMLLHSKPSGLPKHWTGRVLKESSPSVPEQTDLGEAVREIVHGKIEWYGRIIFPDNEEELKALILSLIHPELLSDVEKKHITNALQKLYGDEWCTCCEEIVRKLALDKETDV